MSRSTASWEMWLALKEAVSEASKSSCSLCAVVVIVSGSDGGERESLACLQGRWAGTGVTPVSMSQS